MFLDIDGTLSHPGGRIPASARRACRAARRAGTRLFICTGRALVQIPREVTRIGFDGVVCSGGAQVYCGGALVYSACFDEPTLNRITAFLDARQTAYVWECPDRIIPGPYLFGFYDNMAREGNLRGFVTAAMFKRFWRSFERQNTRLARRGGGERPGVCKVVFITAPDDKVFDALSREFAGAVELFDSSIPGMAGGEISPRGVHKGAAVELLAARYAVDRDDVYAFGDGDNDRTMIAAAGHGIAMGNATEVLRNAADDVTDSVERDGLWKAFQKYHLM